MCCYDNTKFSHETIAVYYEKAANPEVQVKNAISCFLKNSARLLGVSLHFIFFRLFIKLFLSEFVTCEYMSFLFINKLIQCTCFGTAHSKCLQYEKVSITNIFIFNCPTCKNVNEN